MKIKKITRTKTTSIVLADNEYWGILPDKILHFYSHGSAEFEINEQQTTKLLDDIKKHSWNKLLDYLAYRERSTNECKLYLSQKLSIKEDLVRELLEKAIAKNFINEVRFAELLTDELIRKAKSKTEIKSKLFAKGINETIISQIFQNKFSDKIHNNILEKNLDKARRRFSGLSEKERDEKILNYLTRKGFTYWEVKEKLGEK